MPTPTATKPPVATSVDTATESATTSLYRAAIGPINNDYYLPIFTRFEAADRAGLSWNPAACLYTLNWMVFRQLWRAAGLYLAAVLGAALLLLGAGFMLQLSESTEWGLWLTLVVLSFVVPGLYGNAWFHAASRKKMASALTASATLREACAWLYQRSSTRQRFIWMGLVNLVLAGVAVGAYVAFSHSAPSKPVVEKPGEDRQQRGDKLTMEPAQAVPVPAEPVAAPVASPEAMAASAAAAVASAPAPAVMASAVASAAQTPTPSAVPDPVFLDAMAVAMSRYVSRRPLITAATPETEPAPVPAPASKIPELKVKEKEKPRAQTKAVVAEKAYAINVGLFANGANALNAYTRLVDAGLPALMQEVDTAKGQRTRVRVGPISNRADADAAVIKIRALQLEAVLVQPQ